MHFKIGMATLILLSLQHQLTAQPTSNQTDTLRIYQPYHPDVAPFAGKPIWSTYNTIVFTQHGLRCQRTVEYFGKEDTSSRAAYSDWLIVQDDSLYSWIKQYDSVMKTEQVNDFIYTYFHAGFDQYFTIYTSHPPVNIILFHAGTKLEYTKYVNTADLGKSTPDGEFINLNFGYNQSLKLVAFYYLLKRRLDKWNKQYVFRDVRP